MNPIVMFRYNWQVRDEWFDLCAQLPADELTRERTGGVGSILRTLFHIVVVEDGWISGLRGIEDEDFRYEDFGTLERVRELSASCRPAVEQFLLTWDDSWRKRVFAFDHHGVPARYTYEEVLFHLIAHEIHLIGQLSVWARDVGVQPPSANVISRKLFSP